MTLPANFQFSQGSLQAYVDCPRRFQLRYLLRRAWPAIAVEPALENELHVQQGAAFHRLVHQHILGLPPERLSRMVTDTDRGTVPHRWWHNYLNSAPVDQAKLLYPEVALSAPLSDHRLIAKYDLIATEPVPSGSTELSKAEEPAQRAVILDWKTSHKRPRRRWLATRLQTKVYPYLLVRAGSHLGEDEDAGKRGTSPLQPEQVEMVYWFANYPEDPERFSYDTAQYNADGDYLASLIEEIKNLGENDFPLTTQGIRCRYCPYRSLCQRGVKAGLFGEAESEQEEGDDFEIALDFEQIAEIEF